MMQLVIYSLLVTLTLAYPGYPEFHHSPIIHSAPIISAPLIPAHPTYIKSYSAPIYSTPIIKAPIYAPAPIIKTYAPIPVVKHVAPATSYATITRYIAHPAPIVKTVIASPPIYKSYAVAPLSLHGYSGYHH